MRRPRNLLLCLAALTLGGIGGVGLSGASFSAQKANPNNTFTAATNFCTDIGVHTVTANRDTYVDQNLPTSTFGSANPIMVQAKSAKNQRALVGFTLPTKAAACSVTTASLKLTASGSDSGRTIEALRISASASWSESSTNWNNAPATTGTPAQTSSGNGLRTWDVTSQVQLMYGSSNPNNGFLLKDQTEDSGNKLQQYSSRDASSGKPTLEVTFG